MKLLTFFLISLVLGFLYFDTELTQYGNSILNINNKLPFNALVKYRSEFEGGITILDSHGVSLVGEGVQYWESDFEVDEITLTEDRHSRGDIKSLELRRLKSRSQEGKARQRQGVRKSVLE